MVDHRADRARQSVLDIVEENPGLILKEAMHLKMPAHHDVRAKDIDLKRLGSILYATQEADLPDFESLLLKEGVGPRTLQSLALVSEIIYGTPARFSDPARFSFALGGKDGHPFPVPLQVYDETIEFLNKSVSKAKIGRVERTHAFKKLSEISKRLERNFTPDAKKYQAVLDRERSLVSDLGGRTVFDDKILSNRQSTKGTLPPSAQLSLF